jgi:hypothetical protein
MGIIPLIRFRRSFVFTVTQCVPPRQVYIVPARRHAVPERRRMWDRIGGTAPLQAQVHGRVQTPVAVRVVAPPAGGRPPSPDVTATFTRRIGPVSRSSRLIRVRVLKAGQQTGRAGIGLGPAAVSRAERVAARRGHRRAGRRGTVVEEREPNGRPGDAELGQRQLGEDVAVEEIHHGPGRNADARFPRPREAGLRAARHGGHTAAPPGGSSAIAGRCAVRNRAPSSPKLCRESMFVSPEMLPPTRLPCPTVWRPYYGFR